MTTGIVIGMIVGLVFGSLLVWVFLKQTFKSISMDVLTNQSQLGQKDLESKKELIDHTLKTMNNSMKDDLDKMHSVINEFEKDRTEKFGELSNQLKSLQETTGHLTSALASTKARGQWGERMAEDVLRLAGFIEGVNYIKQKTMDTSNTRPDYTFLLPNERTVNMDVKFPLDNYMHYLETDVETDKSNFKEKFLKDVRRRIKEVTTRDYINPEERTVDYVIVFIPNEQVYSFIHESDRNILDEAMKNKVVICSPLTLYAILAIIRQAMDNFNMERTASQIADFLSTFKKQWDNFIKSFDKMGKKLKDAQDEFDNLTTTRRNQLERPLKQIEDLKQENKLLK